MQKKAVRVGDCVLDGKHIYIQSMLNTRSDDIAGSVAQAKALEQAGCEILRAAIPDKEALKLIPAIKEAVKIPLVADIHFDYRLRCRLSVEANSDSYRGQFWLTGKGFACKIWCTNSRSSGGKCHAARQNAGRLRLY